MNTKDTSITKHMNSDKESHLNRGNHILSAPLTEIMDASQRQNNNDKHTIAMRTQRLAPDPEDTYSHNMQKNNSQTSIHSLSSPFPTSEDFCYNASFNFSNPTTAPCGSNVLARYAGNPHFPGGYPTFDSNVQIEDHIRPHNATKFLQTIPETNRSTNQAIFHSNNNEKEKAGHLFNFPAKLYHILSFSEFSGIISWLSHGRAFRILQPKKIEAIILPQYFKHSKFSSFMRQINGWGFKRITQGPDQSAYYHTVRLFLLFQAS